MKRFQNLVTIPGYLEDAPPSPFFTSRAGDDSTMMKSSSKEFVREARAVDEDEEEDPEDYYNQWVMSNLG